MKSFKGNIDLRSDGFTLWPITMYVCVFACGLCLLGAHTASVGEKLLISPQKSDFSFTLDINHDGFSFYFPFEAIAVVDAVHLKPKKKI